MNTSDSSTLEGSYPVLYYKFLMVSLSSYVLRRSNCTRHYPFETFVLSVIKSVINQAYALLLSRVMTERGITSTPGVHRRKSLNIN